MIWERNFSQGNEKWLCRAIFKGHDFKDVSNLERKNTDFKDFDL